MLIRAADRVLRFLYRPFRRPKVEWPSGRKFAFTIIDDTDMATLENIRPIYNLLDELNMKTSKTVWVFPTEHPEEPENNGDTISDAGYLEFVRDLKKKGFEIAFHCARGGSSKRKDTEIALRQFKDMIGDYPRIHINHLYNKENLYWGKYKLDCFLLKAFYSLTQKGDYYGHNEESEYFWGDLARETISYSRFFHFDEIDVLKIYSGIPFHDPRRPYINDWFIGSDGTNRESFVKLLRPENLDRLEKGGGLCIVYTHLGKEFCAESKVKDEVVARLRDVASRDGWFAPVSDILDYIRQNYGDHTISRKDHVFLEHRWVIEKTFRGTT
jgi:hypothetical protein